MPGTKPRNYEQVIVGRDSEEKQPQPAGERIAKVMARAGLCSRREAEGWIAAGRVAINGKAVASPAINVGPLDRVSVDGAPLPTRERTRLFLYHKPRGLLTTRADPQGRATIFSALPTELPRLISIGRLDFNTEGLLLLTNDGGLARLLELPETEWLRRYRVRAHGGVTQDQLNALTHGLTVGGIRYGAIEATLDRQQGANVWLTMAIREGKNREVRNVLDYLGLKVARLIRVSFGPFQLGELSPGTVEEVRSRTLREQLGERLAAKAGCDFTGPVVGRRASASLARGDDRPESRSQSAPRRPDPQGAQSRASTGGDPGEEKKRKRKSGGGLSFEGRLRRPRPEDGKNSAHGKHPRGRRQQRKRKP